MRTLIKTGYAPESKCIWSTITKSLKPSRIVIFACGSDKWKEVVVVYVAFAYTPTLISQLSNFHIWYEKTCS